MVTNVCRTSWFSKTLLLFIALFVGASSMLMVGCANHGLVIETSRYTLSLPEPWGDYVDYRVEDDGDTVIVFLKDRSAMDLLGLEVNNKGDIYAGGDIGCGMLCSADLADDKELLVYVTNWPYLLSAALQDCRSGDSSRYEYDYLTDSETEALLSLDLGRQVGIDEFYASEDPFMFTDEIVEMANKNIAPNIKPKK